MQGLHEATQMQSKLQVVYFPAEYLVYLEYLINLVNIFSSAD